MFDRRRILDIILSEDGDVNPNQVDRLDLKFLSTQFQYHYIEILENLPKVLSIFPHLQLIDLSNNDIEEELPSNLFRNNNKLISIYLNNNILSSLHSKIFQNLARLELLSLSYNQLTTLSSNLFQSLTKMRILDLRNNQLTSLPPNLFQHTTHLEKLFIGGNRLTSLSPNIFRTLDKLEMLDLGHNQLKRLPEHLFSNNSELDILDVAKNKLTFFSQNIFSSNNHIGRLNLNGNNISTVSLEGLGRSLTHIDVSGNYLSPDKVSYLRRFGQSENFSITFGEQRYTEFKAIRVKEDAEAEIRLAPPNRIKQLPKGAKEYREATEFVFPEEKADSPDVLERMERFQRRSPRARSVSPKRKLSKSPRRSPKTTKNSPRKRISRSKSPKRRRVYPVKPINTKDIDRKRSR